MLLANLSTILDKFFGKKKRKIKILTSTMTTKARIKAGEEIVGKKWEEKFLQLGTRMQILFKNYRNYDRTYRSGTDYSFFYFLLPRWSIIHGLAILPTKRVRSRIKVKGEEEKWRISLFWAPFPSQPSPYHPRYRFSTNLDLVFLFESKDKGGVANRRGHSFRELHSKESRF